MTQKTWRIGVAGLGTVGGGLLQLLAERPSFAPAGGRAVISGRLGPVAGRGRGLGRHLGAGLVRRSGGPGLVPAGRISLSS
jgi:homoserine dehydrogenase